MVNKWLGRMLHFPGKSQGLLKAKEGVANLPQPHWPKSNAGAFTKELSAKVFHEYWVNKGSVEQRAMRAFTGDRRFIPLTFRYRISRHETIRIKGHMPIIRHEPQAGAGTKGFMLYLRVMKYGRMYTRGIAMRFQLARIRDMSVPLPEYRRSKKQ